MKSSVADLEQAAWDIVLVEAKQTKSPSQEEKGGREAHTHTAHSTGTQTHTHTDTHKHTHTDALSKCVLLLRDYTLMPG